MVAILNSIPSLALLKGQARILEGPEMENLWADQATAVFTTTIILIVLGDQKGAQNTAL